MSCTDVYYGMYTAVSNDESIESSRRIFPAHPTVADPQKRCTRYFSSNTRNTRFSTFTMGTFGHGADNHNDNPESKFSKYLEAWTLDELVSVDKIIRDDDPENDRRVSKILIDFMKRLEINSDRLTDLQQRIEDFHSRLRNLQSNNINADTKAGSDALQAMVHVLEDERKTLRNLQRLHYDTWQSAKLQYMAWSPDGDEDIDNDDDCEDPIIVLDPKRRLTRWNGMVQAATEIQARHAMTIEQMSELVIRLKPMGSCATTTTTSRLFSDAEIAKSFDADLEDLYEVVCTFMRSRMTLQLLCQHLMAMGKDALGTSVAKKQEAQRLADQKAGVNTGPTSTIGSPPTTGRVVGAININSPVAPVVLSSVTEASQLCEATYLVSPPFSFVIATERLADDTENSTRDPNEESDAVVGTSTTDAIFENVSVTFVRAWLQYTLIELLKNAMVATVETHPAIVKALATDDDSDSDSDSDSDDENDVPQQLPSLFIHVFDDDSKPGDESVVIQIHDQGGGIREDFDLESLFRFAQRDAVWCRLDEQQSYNEVRSPLRGLGVGLSLSRWHIQHFGGDLTLERRPANTIRVRSESERKSKWHTLDKGMMATIRLPKNASVPLALS